ncbi:hypothetical protein [Christiangramia echinicola]|uniref:hypothetical protein n=1 Tax=Christiangramia echinicola TaxID=279359 RepID=UPI00041BBF65|nr:hypothetical protein [Christiangramia echinicola]
MITNDETKRIEFAEKHASQNQEIRELLYSFDNNKELIKKGTGLGFTHAMCNYDRGNLVILSPNNSMIWDKGKGKYNCGKFFSIGGSGLQYKLDELFEYLTTTPRPLQNAVVNLNAEWLIQAKENQELWELLRKFNVFIDESHQYVGDSSYRSPQGEALELIYNEFTGQIVRSTATPIPYGFDIPKDLKFQLVEISRSDIALKRLGYSENLHDYQTFINSELEKGRSVCVFSNNKDIHTYIPPNLQEDEIVNLVGDNLAIKLLPYDRGNKDVKKPRLRNLSSAFFTGYDIDDKCSVVVISEQKSPHTKININDCVQAYGRCRQGVYEALYINVPADYDIEGKKINCFTSEDEVLNEIDRYFYKIEHVKDEINRFGVYDVKYATTEGYVNRGEIGSSTLQAVHDYYQFNEDKRIELFKSYNFELYDYEGKERNDEKIPRPKIAQQLKNLYQSKNYLYWKYLTIKQNLRYKKKPGFTPALGLMYLSIHLIKEFKIEPCIEILNKSKMEPLRLYSTLDKWLRLNFPMDYLIEQLTPKQVEQLKPYRVVLPHNLDDQIVIDWHMFFAMYRVSVGNYDPEIKRYLKIAEMAGNKKIIKKFHHNKSHRMTLAPREVEKAVKNKYKNVTQQDKDLINKVLKRSFKRIDGKQVEREDIEIKEEQVAQEGKYTNMEKVSIQHNKVINLLIQLLHMGDGKYANVRKGNREYGAITEVAKKLRCLVPLKFIEFDMISANPQAIDYLYDTTIAFQVYKNIMKNMRVSREEAKTLFSTYLNNHRFSKKKARTFYKDICKYPDSKALMLAKVTADVKRGTFFEKMTEVEDNLMSMLAQHLEINSLRFHDALILPAWECKGQALPALFNGFRFDISYFNCKDNFHCKTVELEGEEQMEIELKSPKPIESEPTFNELVMKLESRDKNQSSLERILSNYQKTG